MLGLLAMDKEQYEDFMAFTLVGYMKEKVKAGTWLPEHAEKRALEDMSKILPDGYHTENAYFYRVIDRMLPTPAVIGFIWFHIHRKNEFKEVFLYDISILDVYQGRGYGEKTMRLLEEEARRLQAVRIGLHVFGHNERALRLYHKMGFYSKSITMYKELP
ncbi:GNAT family N-acetyltransferase [Paenibacillus sp. Marseille-Q4541]|uniref:GNAT family N-acetyltransferase n=1 Tax=Paenibacillus sp. Marseille-Q4541 TaxID=2831522 RepID=UPI001BA627D7|nr:GNAT family N-acetyltransferase [Paenibacillus sp. Marseille-Q4541]